MEKIKKFLNECKSVKITIIILLVLLGCDQGLKIYSAVNLQDNSVNIIENVLVMKYQKLTGVFYGIKMNNKIALIFADALVIALIIKFVSFQKDNMNTSTKAIMGVILAGGFSNLIDRVFLGGISDYFQFVNFKQPLCFNLSDLYIMGGFVAFVFVTTVVTHNTVKEVKKINRDIEKIKGYNKRKGI